MLRCTVVSLAELIYRLANVVLSVSALVVGALIVIEISRRPTARREPLGMAIALVFVAVGDRRVQPPPDAPGARSAHTQAARAPGGDLPQRSATDRADQRPA